MILASLRDLAVPLVLSAAARLARTASLHFEAAATHTGIAGVRTTGA
jgi:hypothetical protein